MPITRVWPKDVARTVYSNIPNGDLARIDTVYAQVVEIARSDGSRTIHVAGTFSADIDRKLIGEGDMAKQVSVALENIRRSLTAVGATVSDIVRMKYYATEMEPFVACVEQMIEFFDSEALPVSTALQVAGLALPGALIEIEAYAEIL
jgi:enamine deaminase RidA (YjgF/YER057c/UK114 family)